MLGITNHNFSSPRIYELASAFTWSGRMCDGQVGVLWCAEKEEVPGMAVCISCIWESCSLTSRKKVIFYPFCHLGSDHGDQMRRTLSGAHTLSSVFPDAEVPTALFSLLQVVCLWFTSDKNIECSGETEMRKHIPGALKCCFQWRRFWNPPSDFAKGKREQ